MIRVLASSVIDVPPQAIWPLLRDFGAVSQWLPGVAESSIEDGGGASAIGSTRRLTFADGSAMRERLLALSDDETLITFAIIESELPISNYKSTIRLRPITHGDRTYITWEGEFDVAADQEAAMARRMHHDIYQPSFDSLRRRFDRG